ncbi:hypothetical protein [Cryptosporangium sp. NPDC048952]|uniref:hypothetical protein n=1 Tax=Cryptosporangium sp. NPDC048952 TaxID=3363961 RepID=UPI0037201C8D
MLRVGLTLLSAVDNTSVLVMRASSGDGVLTCGGAPMLEKGAADEAATADPAQLGGTQLGKRYSDEANSIEVLCLTGGEGSLALDGRPLSIQGARPLPASD